MWNTGNANVVYRYCNKGIQVMWNTGNVMVDKILPTLMVCDVNDRAICFLAGIENTNQSTV